MQKLSENTVNMRKHKPSITELVLISLALGTIGSAIVVTSLVVAACTLRFFGF